MIVPFAVSCFPIITSPVSAGWEKQRALNFTVPILCSATITDQTCLTTNLDWDTFPSWGPAIKSGSLEVKSSPSKAKIYIDDIYTEQVTRWKFDDMAPGDYKVYVTLEGYSTSATETVKVISGQTASLHFKLDKIKKVK